MKARWGYVIGIGLLITTAGTALAGMKGSFTVSVNTSTMTATGSMGSARNSSDGQQYIGCQVSASSSSSSATVSCFASDSTGKYAGCTSSTPAFVQAAQAIAADSWISFTYNSSSICTSLKVAAASYFPPKNQ